LALAILIQLLVPALAPPPLWAQRRQPDTVLSLDTDVLGGALSYARAEGPGRYRGVEAGIGDAFLHGGLVSGRHFEDTELFELLHAAVFRRWVPSDRLSADVGARASVFVHVHASGDGPGLPLFAGVYANAMVGGRRLKVGPRVLVGMFSEGSSARGFGVYLVPLSVRFSFGW
jgi:hypothetical protein